MQNYLGLLERILKKGVKRPDRTGTGTISLFGEHLEFDLFEGFPLVTTKSVFFRGVIFELMWLLSGNTNINYLLDNKVHIWDDFADSDGNLGPVYGAQFRNFNNQGIDQVFNLIEQIKKDPYSRRHIIVIYNPAQIKEMALPPCPSFLQYYVNGDEISCHLYQRSADMFLGVPFDIASYALLLEMIARQVELKARKLFISYGDSHIYLNHIKQVKEQLGREPLKLPTIELPTKNIFDYKYEDIKLVNYKHYDKIEGKISV